MLQLYRRHTPDCPFSGKPRDSRGAKGCKAACPIWVQGSLGGDYVRKALNLRSWEAAADLVRGWEASGTIGVVKPDVPTVSEAVTKFLADASARQLSKSTISKQKNVLEKRLLPWAQGNGLRLLKQLDVDSLRRFRATWPDSAITASRNLERLRNFFGFCLDAGWIVKNPAKAVRPPKATHSPTLPFEPDDFERILSACDSYSMKKGVRASNAGS